MSQSRLEELRWQRTRGRFIGMVVGLLTVVVIAAYDLLTRTSPEEARSSFVSGVAALAGLDSVRPGMTIADLRRIRPNVVYAPGIGMREQIGRDTVWYAVYLPDAVQSGRPGPPDSEDVREIYLLESTPSPAAAESIWVARARTLRKAACRATDPETPDNMVRRSASAVSPEGYTYSVVVLDSAAPADAGTRAFIRISMAASNLYSSYVGSDSIPCPGV